MEKQILFLSKKTNTNRICVTKGEDGAILYFNDQFFNNRGYAVKVVDTVGAGDSFLASLISELLNKSLPEEALNYACAVGALVAKNKGANSVLKLSDIQKFIKINL